MTTEVIKINNNTEIKTTRHQNGDIQSKPYVGGKTHGMMTWRRKDGTKRYKKMWRDGKQHGLETWWDKNGTKWSEEMRRDGKQHGLETGWYDSGQKEWKIIRANGEKNGVRADWHESGERKEETYFVRGQECAKINWDKEGKVTEVYLSNSAKKPEHKLKKFISSARKLVYI